jgi:hypothetical protein
MSFGGRLETLDLSALLQTLSVGVASGRLGLTRLDQHAVLVLREGRIVYAAGGHAEQTLAGLLLREKLVGEKELMTAVERQHDGTGFTGSATSSSRWASSPRAPCRRWCAAAWRSWSGSC